MRWESQHLGAFCALAQWLELLPVFSWNLETFVSRKQFPLSTETLCQVDMHESQSTQPTDWSWQTKMKKATSTIWRCISHWTWRLPPTNVSLTVCNQLNTCVLSSETNHLPLMKKSRASQPGQKTSQPGRWFFDYFLPQGKTSLKISSQASNIIKHSKLHGFGSYWFVSWTLGD